jgi:hypothetical protein
LAKEFLSSRKLEPRASREISPSHSGGRSLRQALITLLGVLFAPLRGLLSISQKDAKRSPNKSFGPSPFCTRVAGAQRVDLPVVLSWVRSFL